MTSHAGEIAQNLTRTSHIQARKMEGHLGLDDDDNSDDDGDAHGDHLDSSHNFHLRELLLLPEGSLHIRKQNKSDMKFPTCVIQCVLSWSLHIEVVVDLIHWNKSMLDVNPN